MDANLEQRLGPSGLMVLGVAAATADDRLPELDDGAGARSIAIIGNAGPAMWRAYQQAANRSPGLGLDDWTRETVGAAASDLGLAAIFAFDGPPYWPIQRWAARARIAHHSPLGILIHPTYGLWHAYRAAVLSPQPAPPPAPVVESPCQSCVDQPCLSTCPVGAFDGESYDVESCRNYITSAADDPCLAAGCLARRACPVGRGFVYSPEQANFHMVGFLGVAGRDR